VRAGALDRGLGQDGVPAVADPKVWAPASISLS
jgi:hypothetical protein